MIVKLNKYYKDLIPECNERQIVWLAFWSYMYGLNDPQTWYRLHNKDFEFMLGIDEDLYMLNSSTKDQNITAKRIMGEALANEFEWCMEDKLNVLWRSKSIVEHCKTGKTANKPSIEVEITEPHLQNMWMYLLGRLHAGVVEESKRFGQTTFYTRYTLDPDIRFQMSEQW